MDYVRRGEWVVAIVRPVSLDLNRPVNRFVDELVMFGVHSAASDCDFPPSQEENFTLCASLLRKISAHFCVHFAQWSRTKVANQDASLSEVQSRSCVLSSLAELVIDGSRMAGGRT